MRPKHRNHKLPGAGNSRFELPTAVIYNASLSHSRGIGRAAMRPAAFDSIDRGRSLCRVFARTPDSFS